MIDVLGRAPAVLAGPSISSEYRPARQRGSSTVGDADEIAEPDDGGCRDFQAFRSEQDAIRRDDVGLLLQYEDYRPSRRYDCEGLLRRVQYERSTHGWIAASITTALLRLGLSLGFVSLLEPPDPLSPARMLDSVGLHACNLVEGKACAWCLQPNAPVPGPSHVRARPDQIGAARGVFRKRAGRLPLFLACGGLVANRVPESLGNLIRPHSVCYSYN